MASPHPWFRGPEFHSIVFDAPTPSIWIVLERVNEHEHRKEPDHSAISYAYNRYILMLAAFSETEAIGFSPLFPSPKHLVWDSASGNLFMVGFRRWIEVKPTPWSEAKSYWFDLAKPPKKINWPEWINTPDTSNWEF
ncbi:unnamed protein product [Penicillium nalgiovense]|nr:unnamed protein product [Penicillium nalgiovense]